MSSIRVFFLCAVAVSVLARDSHAAQDPVPFPIRRETESQSKERLMRALSRSNLEGQRSASRFHQPRSLMCSCPTGQ